uniref:Sulfotransferase n=1 Tax=Macaca fascicularis TaxID=9541 RepID=A0A7N9DFR1_MACFA
MPPGAPARPSWANSLTSTRTFSTCMSLCGIYGRRCIRAMPRACRARCATCCVRSSAATSPCCGCTHRRGPAARAPDTANLTTAALFRWRTNKVICSPPLCPGAPRARAEVGLVEDTACERSCPPVAIRALEAECRKYPVVVIKDVRLLDLGVLVPLLRDPGLNLKVVQLFRDPRAVHNSRLKSRQGLLRESIQVLRTRQRGDRFHRVLLAHGVGARPGGQSRALPAAPRADFFLTGALEVICEAWLRDLLFARGAPAWLRRRYLRLRYEDLVRQPRAQLRRLLRFSGLRARSARRLRAQHDSRRGLWRRPALPPVSARRPRGGARLARAPEPRAGAPGGGRLRSSHASACLPSQRRGGRRGAAQGRGDAAGDGCR